MAAVFALNRWNPGILGLYSLSDKTSYRQISWSLGAARLDVAMVVSLWNLTGTSAAALPRYLPNFRAIGKILTRISRLRDFTRSCGKTSYRLVNRCPETYRNRGITLNLNIFTFPEKNPARKMVKNSKWTNTWWRHDMERLSASLTLCEVKSPVTCRSQGASNVEPWCFLCYQS